MNPPRRLPDYRKAREYAEHLVTVHGDTNHKDVNLARAYLATLERMGQDTFALPGSQ